MDKNSYSINVMLRYAFEYELTNYLKIKQLDQFTTEDQQKIILYLENRIKEFSKKT